MTVVVLVTGSARSGRQRSVRVLIVTEERQLVGHRVAQAEAGLLLQRGGGLETLTLKMAPDEFKEFLLVPLDARFGHDDGAPDPVHGHVTAGQAAV